MTSDSSESSFVDSLSGSTTEDSDVEELKGGDNAERQQLIRLLESQSVEIQRNVKHDQQLQTELDELDCLTLLDSIELTQHQVEVIEQKNASVEMELAGFEHLIAEADCIAHYDDLAKRNCLHELISRQLILNKRLTDEMAHLELKEREIEAQIASQTSLLLEDERDEGHQDQQHVKTRQLKQLTIEQNVDADNESSDTEQRSSERLNSFDSWQSDDQESGSQSSSSDGGGDSGLPGDTSYSEDSDNRKDASETGSINTSDSALSSMHNSDDAGDYTRYKTIKKKRLPDWWQQNQDQSINHLAELMSEAANTNNLDLSCDDDAPFGNSEYIKKIRAKNAKMANLVDQHQFLSNSSSNSKVYRSASTRRRMTQFGAQCQNTNNLQTARLKRSQSLKTVETLV